MVYNLLGVIAFNLLFGLQGGIDNAAHTGGLILGIVYGGVLMLRSNRFFVSSYNLRGSIVTVVLVLVAFVGVYLQIPNTNAKYLTMVERFGEREREAMEVMKKMDQNGRLTNGAQYIPGLEQGIALWDESIADLTKLQEQENLGEQEAREVEILLNYSQSRKTSYSMMLDDIRNNKPWMHPQQQRVLWAISTYVQDLNNLREGKPAVQHGTDAHDLPLPEALEQVSGFEREAMPLIVLDGEMLEGESLEHIEDWVSAEEIEKVAMLKGEEAVTKYGEKARNGVIEITKKQE